MEVKVMIGATEAYARLGVTARTVWNWERWGWIPAQGHMKHRVYTEHQVRLMLKLKIAIRRWSRFRDYKHGAAQIKRSITIVHRRWEAGDEAR